MMLTAHELKNDPAKDFWQRRKMLKSVRTFYKACNIERPSLVLTILAVVGEHQVRKQGPILD